MMIDANADPPWDTVKTRLSDVLEELPDLPMEVKQTAWELADAVENHPWATSGKSPTTLAVACIYAAELIHDREDAYDQKTLAAEVGTSTVSIRNCYRDLFDAFLESATADHVENLGGSKMQLIRGYAAAVDDGVSNLSKRTHDTIRDYART